MNNPVQRTIAGQTVEAYPIFKGHPTPLYWLGSIGTQTLAKRFSNASDVFQFVYQQSSKT